MRIYQKNNCKKILLILLLNLFICEGAFSDKKNILRFEPLKGLKELKVGTLVLGGIDYAITDDSLRYYVEGRLRNEGIKILDKDSSGSAFVFIRVDIVGSVISISFDTHDWAYLARDRSILCCPSIWQTRFTAPFIKNEIHSIISAVLSRFLEAYRKANPKKIEE